MAVASVGALLPAFDEFERGLRNHMPSAEAGVREVLAQSIRHALTLGPSDVVVEAAVAGKRLDVLVLPLRIGIELKYHRPIPSGRSRPMTQQYGQLLADVRKLAAVELDGRLVVLVADPPGVTHALNKSLLPVRRDDAVHVTATRVLRLAESASGPAIAGGSWIEVRVQRIFRASQIGDERMSVLAWTVERVS